MAHNSIVLLLLLELQCSVLQCCLWNPEGHGFCCTFWMSVTALTRIRVDSESGAECVRLARLDSQLRTMLLITAAAAAASTPHRVGSDTSNQQSVVANAVGSFRTMLHTFLARCCVCMSSSPGSFHLQLPPLRPPQHHRRRNGSEQDVLQGGGGWTGSWKSV